MEMGETGVRERKVLFECSESQILPWPSHR